MTKTDMYRICNEKQWFTHGTNEQYSKLYYALEMGAPLEEIVTIIWLCSSNEHCRRDIKFALLEAGWEEKA